MSFPRDPQEFRYNPEQSTPFSKEHRTLAGYSQQPRRLSDTESTDINATVYGPTTNYSGYNDLNKDE